MNEYRNGVFIVIALCLLGALCRPAYATCTFDGGNGGVTTFVLPPTILINPDDPVGTVIYDDKVESVEITLVCDDRDAQVRDGYTAIVDADARENVLPGVYKTNVPGIGVRAAASTVQFPDFMTSDLIRPMHFVGYESNTHSTFRYRTAAQLVIIGDVQEGYLDTSRLYSELTYDNVRVGGIQFSPASVHITTNTCNLVDRNIYVPLRTINSQDFDGQYSAILTDDRFKIEITNCAAGTQVDYQFRSAGSTGVTNGNILKIAEGDLAASGVGIQILDKNNAVINFDQEYNAISSTSDKAPVEIPLKARYIKTGEVKPGKVDAIATFEVYYR